MNTQQFSIRRLLHLTFYAAIVMVIHRLGGLGIAYVSVVVMFIFDSLGPNRPQ